MFRCHCANRGRSWPQSRLESESSSRRFGETTGLKKGMNFGKAERDEMLERMPVAAQVDAIAACAAQHELAAATLAVGRHFVHEHIESDDWRHGASRIGETYLVAAGNLARTSRDRRCIASAGGPAHARAREIALGNREPRHRLAPPFTPEMELDTIAVDVGMLVVELGIRRIGRAEMERGLAHGDEDLELRFVGSDEYVRARCTRIAPAVLGATIVGLGEVAREREWVRSGCLRGCGRQL